MPWWGWVAIGWAAVSIPVGVAVARSIRIADRREQQPPPTVGPAGLAAANAATLDQLVDGADLSLAGAILTLAFQTDETAARYWLAQCARRGADWTLQRELWETWQAERARDVTTLHTEPTCPPHDPEPAYPYRCRRCGTTLPTF